MDIGDNSMGAFACQSDGFQNPRARSVFPFLPGDFYGTILGTARLFSSRVLRKKRGKRGDGPVPEFLLLIGIIILLCVVCNRVSQRLGIPMLLIFILLGMFFGTDGIVKIPFDDFPLAERICSAARRC